MQGSSLLQLSFAAMGIVLGLAFIAGIFLAWRRSGASAPVTRRATLTAAACTALWLGLTFAAARSGRLRFEPFPPTMAPVILGVFAIAFGVGLSKTGERLATTLPLALLVGVQGFRLPLELMMHEAMEQGLMPAQMSYSGYNFDIVTGATALIVAGLLLAGRAGARLVWAWNIMGTLLLANVVTIALLSAPGPWRVFTTEPANVWVTQAPYVWLPAVMVTMALLGHIVIFRKLRLGAGAPVSPVRAASRAGAPVGIR